MKTFTYLVILIVIGVGCYYAGIRIGENNITKQYNAKIASIFPEQSEIKSVSGKIKSINGNTLVLSGMLSTGNILEEPKQQGFTFSINDQTKIIKRVMKSPEEISAESEAMKDNPQNFNPFIDTVLSIGDLQVGMEVSVTAADNLKNTTKSTALEVIYSEPIVQPTPPTQ